MKDSDLSKFKEYAEQYWSNAVGALTTSVGSAFDHYANLNMSEARRQKNVVAKLDSAYKEFSDAASGLIAKAKDFNVDPKNTVKVSFEFIERALERTSSELKSKLDSAGKMADSFRFEAINYKTASLFLNKLGVVGDVVNIGVKTFGKDYYGAVASFVGAATTIGVASLMVASSAFITVPLIIGLGYFVPELVDKALNHFDPFGINEKTNTDFQAAQNFVQRIDPLALDLDGDGIETVSANAGITFDFNGDGIKTGTGWLSGDDGFLVLDRNDNGTIDNGSELFGIDTVKSDGTLATDGFDALRDLDSNGDGIFDAQDELFDKVRVWQDKNQDGISQADELKTLKEHGISAINLDSTASSTIDNGNLISSIGTMKLEDGSSGTGGNLDLASNPFYREYTDKLPISEAIAALPEMRGSGAVRDLREAASQSAELAKLLTQYSELSSREEQRAMLRPIISAWANSAERPHLLQRFQAVAGDDIEVEIRPSSSNPIDNLEQIQLLTKIGILEVFNASDFYNITRNTDGTFTLQAGANVSAPLSTTKTPEGKEKLVITLNDLPVNAVQIDLLNQAYDSLSNSVYQGLLQQTRLMPYLQAIGLSMEEDGINLDYSGIYQKMAQTHAINPVEAIVTSIELQELLADTNLSAGLESRRSAWISGLNEQDSNRLHAQLSDGGFNALTMGHLLVGTAGNDSLTGNQSASNQLYGGAGDDVLRAPVNSKDNLLAGGTGNDTLHGSHNSDTYIFNAGDGQDTIIESGSNTDAVDVLRFGEGITAQDLWFEQTLQDLKISVHGSADSVTVKDWYKDSDHRIEQIHLSNGDRLLESQVQSLVDAMASFSAQSGAESAFTPTQREQLDTVIAANWQ